jgi:hypothetical protein
MLLGIVAIAALGLAYWGNVTGRERYLQSRNFRLLADVAEQTQTVLYDAEQIIHRSIRAAKAAGASDETSKPLDKEAAGRWASKVTHRLPKSKRRDRDEEELPTDRRIAPMELWSGVLTIQPSAASFADTAQRLELFRTSVLGVGSDLRLEWTAREEGLPTLSFQLPAAALLTGALNQARWDRVFSTMAIATPDGRIVFAVGPQAEEVKASGVAALLPGASEKDGPNLMRFASAIADEPVRITGINYRMFTQPCCRTDSLTSGVNARTPGLVVIGLSEADALRSLSLAISPVLVLSGGAFVMACARRSIQPCRWHLA